MLLHLQPGPQGSPRLLHPHLIVAQPVLHVHPFVGDAPAPLTCRHFLMVLFLVWLGEICDELSGTYRRCWSGVWSGGIWSKLFVTGQRGCGGVQNGGIRGELPGTGQKGWCDVRSGGVWEGYFCAGHRELMSSRSRAHIDYIVCAAPHPWTGLMSRDSKKHEN